MRASPAPGETTASPEPADASDPVAALHLTYRAQVSHPGVVVACPRDLLVGTPEDPARRRAGIEQSGAVVDGARSDAERAAELEEYQAQRRSTLEAIRERLAACGITLLSAGSSVPVTASGVIDGAYAFRFRSRSVTCQLWVYEPSALVVMRREPVDAEPERLPLHEVGTTRLLAAKAAADAFSEAWCAWYGDGTALDEASEPQREAFGSDVVWLDPPIGEGVAWVGHVEGDADFAWEDYEASCLSLEALERIVAHLVDAARAELSRGERR